MKPCNFELSNSIKFSRVQSVRVGRGALRCLSCSPLGASILQLRVFLISSALTSNFMHFDLSLSLSELLLASLIAFIYISAAKIALFKASALVEQNGMRLSDSCTDSAYAFLREERH